jgi:uncharacterized protein (TIGR02246 family)
MQLRPIVYALGLGVSVVLGACAAQQSSASGAPRGAAAVRTHIEQIGARFAEAYNRGDIAAVGALYDADAIVLAPNAPPMRGRQNIEAFWGGARQQGFRSISLTTTAVEVTGDYALELGNYRLVIQPPGQGEGVDQGKFMVVWKRQPDGTWKIYRDMFNTSMPAR